MFTKENLERAEERFNKMVEGANIGMSLLTLNSILNYGNLVIKRKSEFLDSLVSLETLDSFDSLALLIKNKENEVG
jgi:hypothetical protein